MTSASATEDSRPPSPTPVARPGARTSLAAGLAGHNNSFGVLRLVLASAVIFSHAFYLGGWTEDPFLNLVRRQENLGGIAVFGFFAISGYLITKSGMGADALQFIWRRILRIFPAYWLVLLVAAVIVGPAAWLIEGRELAGYLNLHGGGPIAYLVVNADLTIRQPGINGIYVDSTPYGVMTGVGAFNGSLWTLSYEWACYLLIAVLVLVGVLRRARWVVPVLTTVFFAAAVAEKIAPGLPGRIFPPFGDHYTIALTATFLYGACLAIYSRRVSLHPLLAVSAAVAIVATLALGWFSVIGYPALAYLVLWLAARLPAGLHWIGRKNDYSYGIYIYGWLVQQFTALLGWYQLGYWPWVATSLALAAGCAWLSWHGVEKHALALKDAGPGRGIRYWYSRMRRTPQPDL